MIFLNWKLKKKTLPLTNPLQTHVPHPADFHHKEGDASFCPPEIKNKHLAASEVLMRIQEPNWNLSAWVKKGFFFSPSLHQNTSPGWIKHQAKQVPVTPLGSSWINHASGTGRASKGACPGSLPAPIFPVHMFFPSQRVLLQDLNLQRRDIIERKFLSIAQAEKPAREVPLLSKMLCIDCFMRGSCN